MKRLTMVIMILLVGSWSLTSLAVDLEGDGLLLLPSAGSRKITPQTSGYGNPECRLGIEITDGESLASKEVLRTADATRERELVVLINQYRRSKGRLPYKMDSLLTNAARGHSTDMATHNFFSHVGSDSSSFSDRITNAGYIWSACGETIAAGSSTAQGTINQWKGSPPHRAIMLSTSYREIGTGYAYDASSTYGHYWTGDYGARFGVYPMVINDDEESTSSANVTLYVHAPGGATQMRFRNASGYWSGWEAYQTSRSWTLTSGSGTRTVYSEVSDGGSTYSSSDDISLEGGSSSHLVLASGDYNGDGHDDIAIFRPSSGLWSVRGLTRVYFGGSSDTPAPGDYNADGVTDFAVFRGSSGLWAVRGITRVYFGASSDTPVPGDYNGDGYCDIGIFRPGSGLWAVRGFTRVYYGSSSDTPVPGDYSLNSRVDIAIFRPSSGLWAVRGLTRCYFGSSSDTPVPGNYLSYSAWTPAIFRPSSGLWAVRGVTRCYFGGSSDQPVPADYAGSGADSIGIFRGSSGLWAVRGMTRVYFGTSGDIPVTR